MSTGISRHFESGYWMIFGEREDVADDGSIIKLVDIANREGDVLTLIPFELAEKIVELHNASLEPIQLSVERDHRWHESEL